jgi:hypothetical protein
MMEDRKKQNEKFTESVDIIAGKTVGGRVGGFQRTAGAAMPVSPLY